ncbi:hypothetical protein CKF48_22000 [Cytobacillus kochii]|uniref:Sigma-54 factor interaction domain-containing protein n=1 Tax=Cytobacillus kochii TaxID=859143 RepID=A0A248TND5_9BACI|nr:hypothetical protein CKF48_22000 [Cytobacillus kochii]
MRQYTNGKSRLFVIITLISVKVVILLLSELYKSEITTIAIRFFRHYSCKIHIYFENCDRENSTFSVLIEEKLRKTRNHIGQLFKESCSICTDLCTLTEYPDEEISMTPIRIADQIVAYLVIQNGMKNEQRYETLELIDSQLDLCKSTIEIKLQSLELERLYHETLDELQIFLQTTSDVFVLINKEDIIETTSQTFSSINEERLNVVGLNISTLMYSKDWERLKKDKVIEEVELLVNKGKATVSLRTIKSNDVTISYLIQILMDKGTVKKPIAKQTLYTFQQIKGTSHSIQKTIEKAQRVANSDSSILLRGESGTGKEIFAQAIHHGSNRSKRPFIALNCAAIPESLLESELFGHVKGAFTGSHTTRVGRFELANGGTLFLDEIGDLSPSLQAKLLRVVQERRIEKVGDNQSTPVDVRIITATHQNLEQLVQVGKFRKDLYYRLNVIPIVIPPLRDRREDIPILIEYFMKNLSKQAGKKPKRISKEVLEILLKNNWSGNIRELQNVVHHFVQLEIGELVTQKSLPTYLKDEIQSQIQLQPNQKRLYRKQSNENKEEILRLLDEFGRDTLGKKRVAKSLNISLPTLYRKLNKLRIK